MAGPAHPAFLERLRFKETADLDFPWETEWQGHRLQVRLNEFPEEPFLYSLMVDGAAVAHFDSPWPTQWSRPKPKRS